MIAALTQSLRPSDPCVHLFHFACKSYGGACGTRAPAVVKRKQGAPRPKTLETLDLYFQFLESCGRSRSLGAANSRGLLGGTAVAPYGLRRNS